jgi:hypothetical protein
MAAARGSDCLVAKLTAWALSAMGVVGFLAAFFLSRRIAMLLNESDE